METLVKRLRVARPCRDQEPEAPDLERRPAGSEAEIEVGNKGSGEVIRLILAAGGAGLPNQKGVEPSRGGPPLMPGPWGEGLGEIMSGGTSWRRRDYNPR